MRVHRADDSVIFSHPHAVQSLGPTSLLAHNHVLPKPTSFWWFLVHLKFPDLFFCSRYRCSCTLYQISWGMQEKTSLIPYLGFHNPTLSHDTIVVPHNLNPAKTKPNAFVLLVSPPSISRESKIFQGVVRGEVSGRNCLFLLERRNPLWKEDLNSTCITGKEREDSAVPMSSSKAPCRM